MAVIGDSLTFGNGINVADRFTADMQRWLGDRIEILNLGVPGHNTPQHAQTLRWAVQNVAPDFALVQWFVNDVEGSNLEARPPSYPLVPWTHLHDWLHYRSALYTLLDARWADLQSRWLTESYASSLQRRFGDADSAASVADEQAMSALVSSARATGVELGIVLFPDTGYDLGGSYPFAFLHARVLDFCATASVACLDLRGAFEAVADRRKLWVNPWDHHPSVLANAIAASQITKAFGPRFLDHRHRAPASRARLTAAGRARRVDQ